MSLPLSARLALRELRGGLRGFRIFLACLALGVAAIAAVGSTRAAIEAGLTRDGAALLGGEAEAEFTYRFASAEERDWLESISEAVSETVDFRSLAVAGEGGAADRALTQVRGVDSTYPLIGAVELDPPLPLAEALAGDRAVMERVLADRLALAPGDSFRLGEKEFTLSAILDRYPDNASAGFGLGPRTLLRTAALDGSGLLAEGTMFSTQYRLTLPEGADLDALEAEAEARFREVGLRWRDARRGAGGTARFVDRIGAFLVLVGLAGLAVGGVGVASAVSAYLSGKTEVIAILKTLGATRATIFRTYFLQIGALTVLGVTLGLALGAALPLLAGPAIEARLPIPAIFALYPAPLFEAGLYGLLAALIFTLWPLARTEAIRAAALFRDGGGETARPRWPYLVAIAALALALTGAAIWFSGTAFLTLWTAGGIAAALVLLALAARGVAMLARRARRRLRGRPGLRLALASIGARGGETTSVVLSLGLGLTVLAAVGQIDGNLRRSLSADLPDVAPSYFFLDIQPGQIDGFRARVEGDPGVDRMDTAPMLRGIITRINGLPAEEVAEGHWVTRGDRGVTYAGAQPEGTKVTAGAWWPEDYTGPPQISFAAEEAAEIGLQLGDEMTVNILGREITGTVTSFREVSWEDAGIGFVLAMNEGALAGAPHSWIATVYAEEEAEAPLLRDLAGAYPNITAIRIRDAIDQVVELIAGISAATRAGALVTLATGALVLIGAAAAGVRARSFEAAVLKVLGGTRGRILGSFALRAALLGLAAGAIALLAGILGGWAVTTFVMEDDYRVIWGNALGIVLGGALASLLAGLAFAWRPLAVRPAQELRGRE